AHPVAPAFGFARVHQELEGGARLSQLLRVELHAHQAPGVGIHRRFPELLGAHFAQALEARDFPAAFLDLLFLELRQPLADLVVVEAIDAPSWLSLALRWHL